MLEFLNYTFFQNALISVVVISVAAAMIGTYIITRRLVSITGGVTHACFGGLGLGYYLGINPVLMAGVFAITSSVAVEWLSSRFRVRSDSAIAVIWAIGMAIGVIFVFLTPGYVPELTSFLFGNILTINSADILTFIVFTGALLLFFVVAGRYIVVCAFDRDFARVSGLPVNLINYTMTCFIAVCIVLSIRLVGIMLLMSMLSLPMMTAEVWFKRFYPIMIASVAVSVIAGIAGLFIGAATDVPCSAIIVLTLAIMFIFSHLVSFIVNWRRAPSK